MNKLPKAMQPKVKQALRDIYNSDSKANADKAFSQCVKKFSAKYPKAMATLEKDKEELLAFYDFPAEHWTHIRTTNPIESGNRCLPRFGCEGKRLKTVVAGKPLRQ